MTLTYRNGYFKNKYGTYPTEEVIGHLRVGDEHKESLRILVSLVQIIHRDALMS